MEPLDLTDVPPSLTRREFLAGTVAASAAGWVAGATPVPAAAEGRPHLATGVRIGEVTDTSARFWLRLTTHPERNSTGETIKGHIRMGAARPAPADVAKLEGACPGAPGRVRVRYSPREDLAGAADTGWMPVSEATDFTHQFPVSGLKPATVYHFAAETAPPGDGPPHGALRGQFETAPRPDEHADLTFCVLTCQSYTDLDHPDGFHIYPAMARLKPKFLAFTGDNVYYDSEEPRAVSGELARYHWQRMFSLPRHLDLLRGVPTYWQKDDHDTLRDDSWPGVRPMGDLTFAEGQRIFREQVPVGETIYRTFRWGKSLQVWLTDGRDFRSPNSMPDGPEKTIWGREQREWLQGTLAASDATWKVLISPTPLVGPDRTAKNDNHANAGFAHEGDAFREWVRANVAGSFFAICGDRHWQYHSVHPRTGMHEFAVGAASDEHASGSPGLNPEYHRFHRVKGGFLSVTVSRNGILFRHHDVRGEPVYEWKKDG